MRPAGAGARRPRAAAGDPDPLAGVALHRPDAPVYPRAGLTKLDLARFYVEVWPWAERHLTGRPLTVVRRRAPIATPDALRTACTFVRHTPEANAFASVRVPRVRIPERHKLGEYLWIDGLPAVLALLDGGAVELHAWNAPVEDVEHPDRLVLDLDPGEGVGWERVVEAAHALRAELRAAGLESWPKATGGKGLHLVVPLTGRPGWDEVFGFSRAVAEALARARPGAFTTSFSKADRPGRILVDYKRNYRTSIAVAPFSTRATPEATVAVPLAWRELRGAGPPRCTVAALPARLRRQRADPWSGLWDARQRLPRAPR